MLTSTEGFSLLRRRLGRDVGRPNWRKPGSKMPFVIRVDSGKLREGSFRADKVTRFAALETALGLVEQGIEGVTIMGGDNGRIFTPSEFTEFLKGAS
jgi:hypothetical protein